MAGQKEGESKVHNRRHMKICRSYHKMVLEQEQEPHKALALELHKA